MKYKDLKRHQVFGDDDISWVWLGGNKEINLETFFYTRQSLGRSFGLINNTDEELGHRLRFVFPVDFFQGEEQQI